MKIEKVLDGQQLTVKLSGRLDTNTAPELESDLKESLSDVKDMVFDFHDLAYISSAGLRILLLTKKAIKEGEVKVIGVNETIREILEVSGFAEILTIE